MKKSYTKGYDAPHQPFAYEKPAAFSCWSQPGLPLANIHHDSTPKRDTRHLSTPGLGNDGHCS
ncbi:hypothetical protein I79_015502 [Cricetulus griseus]|uniref:Uncharacterized protein n=1 Tax=Cricetulus griseus TaxID=10029 RepID=G3HWY7_CRIGR|nr:hypothetical protein I79_015502 [Cricetulus griseus]